MDKAAARARTEGANVARRPGDLRLALLTAMALLATHALALFLHEYSHGAAAWLFGYKTSPLGITYGHLTLSNVLLQQELDEHVAYDSIMAAGHRMEATIIALAGPGVGNGLLYLVCALVVNRRMSRMRPASLLFLFWLALMASGNLWSYAPVRTIATHGDMGVAAQGLGISSWVLFPFVVLPAVLVGWHFFFRLLPRALGQVFGGDALHRAFATSVACFVFFGFFGSPSLGGDYGDVSAVFSILSMFVMLPVAVMVTLSPMRASPAINQLRSPA